MKYTSPPSKEDREILKITFMRSTIEPSVFEKKRKANMLSWSLNPFLKRRFGKKLMWHSENYCSLFSICIFLSKFFRQDNL